MTYSFERKPAHIAPPPPPSYTQERGIQRAGRAGLRAPMREAPRPEIRGRNGELLTRNNRSNQRADQFELPRGLARPGMTYQWVATSVLGKPQHAEMNDMLENGWRPVPCSDADGYYAAKGHQGAIERGGQMLMERPEYLTQEAIADGVKEARRLKHDQASDFEGVDKMLRDVGADRHAFEAPSKETDRRGWAAPKLKRTVEGIPDGFYPKHEFALGDEE